VAESENILAYIAAPIIENKYCYIDSIAVDEASANKKIGRGLITFIENLCKQNNISEILLEVSEINERAIHLYKKLGFEESGIIQSFYSDGSAGISMIKRC
jgi:ribosomal protein S18 acetylase RimI-like enzyme